MPESPAKQFSGIFVSYRRDDSSGHAGRLFDKLLIRFGEDQIFMDIDTIEPGEDFIQVIEDAVGSCEILIAVIGQRWLSSTDGTSRRLDNPNDFVRLEISAALNRNVRVIPVLVEGARMPRQQDLPDDLARLVRRHALEISDLRWHHDIAQLISVIERVLAKRAEARRIAAEEEEERQRREAETRKLEEEPKREHELRKRLEKEEANRAEAERRQQAEPERQKREAEENKGRQLAVELQKAVEKEKARATEAARRQAEDLRRREAEDPTRRLAAERERREAEAREAEAAERIRAEEELNRHADLPITSRVGLRSSATEDPDLEPPIKTTRALPPELVSRQFKATSTGETADGDLPAQIHATGTVGKRRALMLVAGVLGLLIVGAIGLWLGTMTKNSTSNGEQSSGQQNVAPANNSVSAPTPITTQSTSQPTNANNEAPSPTSANSNSEKRSASTKPPRTATPAQKRPQDSGAAERQKKALDALRNPKP
jgi:hypothetical protein